jgi:lipopolysaccharide/colanic/teichoic acid biosynthesis glycosyltransferase
MPGSATVHRWPTRRGTDERLAKCIGANVEDLVSDSSFSRGTVEPVVPGTFEPVTGRDVATTGFGLTTAQAARKRLLDIVLSILGLVLLSWLIVLAYLAASIDTRSGGFFRQDRVGRNGRTFKVIKIKTMRSHPTLTTSVTTADDPRITRLGRFFRKSKIDELPQLVNVLLGQMSLVGPRPEVPGFADRLVGEDALILTVRPGITGPATLHFRNEEELLRTTADPEAYNATVLFPMKVRMNLDYIRDYSMRKDLEMIWKTIR